MKGEWGILSPIKLICPLPGWQRAKICMQRASSLHQNYVILFSVSPEELLRSFGFVLFAAYGQSLLGVVPVSYTHLDVYKRQMERPVLR